MITEKTAIKQLNELKKRGSSVRLAAEGWNKPWKILIATLLSARTRDETTIRISHILFNRYPNPNQLGNAKLKDVENIIRPVNFYRTKSKNIIACAKILDEKYNGQPPYNLNQLIELPGVGRKTGNVFLAESGKQAIGVDTHVGYISRYLGWSKNSNPHKIEEDLKNLFHEKNWKSINYILVKFGKTHTSRKMKNEILNEIKKIK